MYSEKQAVSIILNKNNMDYNFCLKQKSKNFQGIHAGEMLLAILYTKSLKEASDLLNVSERTVERCIKIFINNKTSAPTFVKLLNSIGLHKCGICSQILELSSNNFWKDNSKYTGFQSTCIFCRSKSYKEYYKNNKSTIINNVGKRKLKIIQATPIWANLSKIKEIYNNCPKGYHVDHIIPLQGEYVSGLHVENNLQYLLAKDNIIKSNKWEVS